MKKKQIEKEKKAALKEANQRHHLQMRVNLSMMAPAIPQVMTVTNFTRGQQVGAVSVRNDLEGRNDMRQLAVTMTYATDGIIPNAQAWTQRVKLQHR